MKTKIIELRDAGTFMPVMAVKLESQGEAERYLLARAGYGRTYEDHNRYVLLFRLAGGDLIGACSPYEQSSGTMQTLHYALEKDWDCVRTGDVFDVEFHRGDTATKKLSERFDT